MKIKLNKIKLFGYHGVYEKEISDGQEFLISISLKVSNKYARSDELDQTIDYSEILKKIKMIFNQKRYNLIESLAKDISREILSDKRIKSVLISIKKPNAPLDIELESTEVVLKEKR